MDINKQGLSAADAECAVSGSRCVTATDRRVLAEIATMPSGHCSDEKPEANSSDS